MLAILDARRQRPRRPATIDKRLVPIDCPTKALVVPRGGFVGNVDVVVVVAFFGRTMLMLWQTTTAAWSRGITVNWR